MIKKLEKELKKNDCIVIKKKIDKRDIQLKRYNIFLDFLISNKYEKILFCDSRDVYFQANPFKYSYKGSINFFLEDIKIKNCIFNKNWMIGTYGLETYIKLSNKIISCGGTIIGSYYGMKKFLELMILETSKHKYKKD
jgi:hypothetical protein